MPRFTRLIAGRQAAAPGSFSAGGLQGAGPSIVPKQPELEWLGQVPAELAEGLSQASLHELHLLFVPVGVAGPEKAA